MFGRWLEVGVPGVRSDGHDRRVIEVQTGVGQVFHDPGLDFGLRESATRRERLPDPRQSHFLGAVERRRRSSVRGETLRSPGSEELLRQLGGADDLHAGPSHELDRPAIDTTRRRQHGPRGILHRHATDAPEDPLERLAELPIGKVDDLPSRSVFERALLDPVDDPGRVTLGGNQAEPSPRERTRNARHS